MPPGYIERIMPVMRGFIDQYLSPSILAVTDVRDLHGPAGEALFRDWHLHSLAYVPLLRNNQFIGTLSVRSFGKPHYFSEDEQALLQGLADQAAIAINNASLFEALQLANTELTLAYDTTLEGWSRALDMRDEETEGHSLRVTDLTVRLAEAVGIPKGDFVHIRRGALLHDIGKMGIPDHILLKPGSLTEDEWRIMRQHPLLAYQLLSPITFLHAELNIPYCHHERWDGSGYPRGLRGEEIPIEARIFAVVDVWDALCSDRPYRRAWKKDDALDYIRNQAEHHFDPRVVAAFLELLSQLRDDSFI
jgi:putative nucleotidyltransferase with HDIG domain